MMKRLITLYSDVKEVYSQVKDKACSIEKKRRLENRRSIRGHSSTMAGLKSLSKILNLEDDPDREYNIRAVYSCLERDSKISKFKSRPTRLENLRCIDQKVRLKRMSLFRGFSRDENDDSSSDFPFSSNIEYEWNEYTNLITSDFFRSAEMWLEIIRQVSLWTAAYNGLSLTHYNNFDIQKIYRVNWGRKADLWQLHGT